MLTQSSQLPRIARTDAGAIMVSEWSVDTADRQTKTVQAFSRIWESEAWPIGLLSVNLFGSIDGTTIVNYAQWSHQDSYQAFTRTHLRSRLVEEIDRFVPGISRKPPIRYVLYRSRAGQEAPPVGCVVIVSVEFDGPDEQRQRRWVDKVFDALEAETELPPGGISGHFHLSTDGTRVLNYAEWTDEDSHRRALASSGQGTIGRDPKWLEIRNYPGVVANEFKRCHLVCSYSSDAKANG
jgi:Antibiotic biosynthesis monooxygenase